MNQMFEKLFWNLGLKICGFENFMICHFPKLIIFKISDKFVTHAVIKIYISTLIKKYSL